ncbi:MAG: DUF3127 domain-containing protein [Muribaculaceae bacterium]|nr:DUF3127 domain-containing protein [Muribaculaceae bacterium]
MDFQAKCIQYLGEVTGTSRAGNPWRKKEWVVETFGQYPKKVKIQCFGEKSALMNIEPGRNYNFAVDLESHEYNGRWYTEVSVYRVEEMTNDPSMGGGFNHQQPQAPVGQPYGNNQAPYPGNETFVSESDSSDEDLPF